MTSKGFGEYTHPVTIRNYDDTVLRDIPPVEAILYIITNVTNGIKYIGSHKLKVFGQWLDGYYQSSSDDDFQLLAVGKLAKPLQSSTTTDTTILVNIDR